MDDKKRMEELIKILNEASAHYYSGEDEIMSNFEYDKLYDELSALEEKSGQVLAGSPTVRVGYEILSELPKEAHIAPMLSLGKTKDVGELVSWLGDRIGILSMKLDGLSIIITYEGGTLSKALTRGNGEIGEVITNNARTFKNLPARIPYPGRLVLRGEALIRYSDFEEIQKELSADAQAQYKNPRNLCSGSVRQLNNEVTASRRVHFYAYNIIEMSEETDLIPGLDEGSKENWFKFLVGLGFDIAPYKMVNGNTLETAVKEFSEEVGTSDLPSDGLVLTYDDIGYSISLGRTAKAPRDSIALKWEDETAETVLREIEWSASRTGLINPVAIFDPVELEGTTVRRASVHNVSVMRQLGLGIGDKILVYKANMIIPQIASDITATGTCEPPDKCPVCGEGTNEVTENGVTVLMCPNPDCYAKQIHSLVHFVSRDAMNIDGLSEATLEKWVGKRYIRSFTDIFSIDRYRDEIISDDTMKIREKSFENLTQAIEKSKDVSLPNLIYALGIRGIGLATAKDIVRAFPDLDLPGFIDITKDELLAVNGIGDTLADGVVEYLQTESNREMIMQLNSILRVSKVETVQTNDSITGKIFVITGSLAHFSNRSECKERIEAMGGRVSSSVSANTDFLVNNDATSNSSKNKKARELGTKIITEAELLEMMG